MPVSQVQPQRLVNFDEFECYNHRPSCHTVPGSVLISRHGVAGSFPSVTPHSRRAHMDKRAYRWSETVIVWMNSAKVLCNPLASPAGIQLCLCDSPRTVA